MHGTYYRVLVLSFRSIIGRCWELSYLSESHDIGCVCHTIISEDLALLILKVIWAFLPPVFGQLIMIRPRLSDLFLLKDFSKLCILIDSSFISERFDIVELLSSCVSILGLFPVEGWNDIRCIIELQVRDEIIVTIAQLSHRYNLFK